MSIFSATSVGLKMMSILVSILIETKSIRSEDIGTHFSASPSIAWIYVDLKSQNCFMKHKTTIDTQLFLLTEHNLISHRRQLHKLHGHLES